jgi:hypothetical protein
MLMAVVLGFRLGKMARCALLQFTMKISELRALFDRTSSEDMKRILVEVYRALPKKTRDDLAIDELLKNPAAAKQAKALAYSVNIDYRSDGLNRLAAFGFLAYVKLSDYDKGIDFFKIHYVDRDAEISLFVLLKWLRSLQREDLWRREYERAVQAGIEPRDSLSGAYRHLKSHGELPRYY